MDLMMMSDGWQRLQEVIAGCKEEKSLIMVMVIFGVGWQKKKNWKWYSDHEEQNQ